jgi:hypothetical protein
MHLAVFIAAIHRINDNVAALSPALTARGHIIVSIVDILPVLCWDVI